MFDLLMTPNNEGMTALQVASFHDKLKMVECILDLCRDYFPEKLAKVPPPPKHLFLPYVHQLLYPLV